MKKLFLTLLSIAAVSATAQEVLKNSTLEKWKKDSSPVRWHGGKKEYSMIPEDYDIAAKVAGNTGQMTQPIKLEKGAYYLISGMICKGGGNNKTRGMIGLRNRKYSWNVSMKGSDKTSEWKKVSKVYRADGTERYFYCLNWYMGKDGACYYAGLSLKKITPEEAKKLINEGVEDAHEILKNNNLKRWADNSSPAGWRGGEKETAIVPEGSSVAVKLKGGRATMTQAIRLKKDTYYLLSAKIYRSGGTDRSKGKIGIRDKKYKWKVSLLGGNKPLEWEDVSKVYKADGSEKYFYCQNWYTGKDGVCYFAKISLKKITAEEAKKLEENK